ncbi:hypothetical protein D3C81_2219450 [compost metagenome]
MHHSGHCGGIIAAFFILNGQRIHVRTQSNHRAASAALQLPDHTVAAYMPLHLKPQRLQMVRHKSRCPFFLI